MTISIDEVPRAAAEASLRLCDELLSILGDDLVAAWLHGGTTFPDRPAVAADLDMCAVVTNVAPSERTPRDWRADPGSRPRRIRGAEKAIEGGYGVTLDTIYLLDAEVGRGAPPSFAFGKGRRETQWAIYRAQWLAGQYVRLHGRSPDELVVPPTKAEIRRALVGELEHLERHVASGDAGDPYEATYAISNGCRILFTLETGSPVISKRSAQAWGFQHLPARWHDVILAAGRAYDGASTPEDGATLRETMAPFVEMVRGHLPVLP